MQIGAGAAEPCSLTGCDHGTHVAGIAAGKSASRQGAAPRANIVAIQVFSRYEDSSSWTPCANVGTSSPCVLSSSVNQLDALGYVLANAEQFNISTVNMSLGGGRSTTDCDFDLRKEVIDDLVREGVANRYCCRQ